MFEALVGLGSGVLQNTTTKPTGDSEQRRLLSRFIGTAGTP